MATHSSILAWKIPWTEEPGRLQSMGCQRVGHNLATEHKKVRSYNTFAIHFLRWSQCCCLQDLVSNDPSCPCLGINSVKRWRGWSRVWVIHTAGCDCVVPEGMSFLCVLSLLTVLEAAVTQCGGFWLCPGLSQSHLQFTRPALLASHPPEQGQPWRRLRWFSCLGPQGLGSQTLKSSVDCLQKSPRNFVLL